MSEYRRDWEEDSEVGEGPRNPHDGEDDDYLHRGNIFGHGDDDDDDDDDARDKTEMI